MSPGGAQALGRIAAVLARGEGLEAHARSAEYRLDAAAAAADEAPASGRRGARACPARAMPPLSPTAWCARTDPRMSSYHVPDASGLLKLDAMENPYQLPAALRQALGRRLAEVALNRYPVPVYGGLKDAIRRTLRRAATAPGWCSATVPTS